LVRFLFLRDLRDLRASDTILNNQHCLFFFDIQHESSKFECLDILITWHFYETTIYIILIIFLTACKTQQLAVIKLNDKFGCVDRKGNIVIQSTWDYILQGDKNKQLLVEIDSLYGFIDSKGQIIITPQYKLQTCLVKDWLA
jgi:hypothetical protein